MWVLFTSLKKPYYVIIKTACKFHIIVTMKHPNLMGTNLGVGFYYLYLRRKAQIFFCYIK